MKKGPPEYQNQLLEMENQIDMSSEDMQRYDSKNESLIDGEVVH